MPAKTTTLPTPAKAPITATGMKGFLLWFQREQPDIFKKIAPQLPAAVPKAFSDYNARFGKLQRKVVKIINGKPFTQMKRPGLGDDTSYFDDALDSSSISLPPVEIAPVDVGQIDLSTPDVNIPNYSPVAVSANSGNIATPVASAVGQIIGAASSIYLTNNQAQLQQAALQTNLQRAAAGLPPLNTSLNQLGVPTISTGAFSGTSGLVFLGIGAAILLALASRRGSL